MSNHLLVEFPVGDVFEDSNNTDTIIDIINKIGPEKVSQLNLTVAKFPLVSKERIVNDKKGYGYSQKELQGGFYLITKTSTKSKKR